MELLDEAYNSRDLEYMIVESMHFKSQKGWEKTGHGMVFWKRQSLLLDTAPLAKLHLLIIPQKYNQLWIEYSNIWTYGGYFHSTHTSKIIIVLP